MKRTKLEIRFAHAGSLAAAALLCCSTLAFGQTGQGSTGSQPQGSMQQSGSAAQGGTMNNMAPAQGSMNDMGDKAFLKKAMQGGMTEVELGKLALTKSSNDQVKQFAQKMIDDHTKLNDQAKPVAQQLGVSMPDGPSKKDKAMMAKMQSLTGDAFDKAYIQDMVKDHKSDESEFKTEASSGQNPQIKDLAAQGEPVIASHLQMVQQIAKSMNLGSGM